VNGVALPAEAVIYASDWAVQILKRRPADIGSAAIVGHFSSALLAAAYNDNAKFGSHCRILVSRIQVSSAALVVEELAKGQ
jgi:hypothetical protein